MIWCIAFILIALTLLLQPACAEETERHPKDLPYAEETIIPYLKLTDGQYTLLRMIYKGIMQCREKIVLPAKTLLTDLNTVMGALDNDYPELIQYSGHYSYRYIDGSPKRAVSVAPQYCMTAEAAAPLRERVMNVVRRVAADCGATVYTRPEKTAASGTSAASSDRQARIRQLWLDPSGEVMELTHRTGMKPSLERIWLNPGTPEVRPGKSDKPARPRLNDKMKQIWGGASGSAAPIPAHRAVKRPLSDMARQAEMLHDALVACTRYRSRKCGDPNVLTAKGALLDGQSNCVGYAKALTLLYRVAGIPCGYVHGSTDDDRSGKPTHAWNIACIDGKYTQIDATWSDEDKQGYVTHFYYGLSDAQMAGDHCLAPETKTPACTDHINWHRMHGCYIRSKEEAYAAIRERLRLGEKLISLRFDGDVLYKSIEKDVPAFVREYNAKSSGKDRISVTYHYACTTAQRCLLINLLTGKP